MTVRILFITALLYTIMLLSCAPLSYTIETEVTGTKVLKGVFDREVLEENPDFSWFTTNYSAYRYDSAVVNRLAPLMNDVHVVMIVGTWCGDSKRELPKQFKIFDALQLSNDKIVVFGVDRSKKSVDGTTQKYRVVKVPTLIVFRGEQELGRIVENPTTSQEEDLLRLLKK